MDLNRRKVTAALAVIAGLGAVGAYFGLGPLGGTFGTNGGTAVSTAAQAQAGADKLMEPGPLEDMVLGDTSAPVTVVEYMSLTCPHCATFHEQTFPALKEKYIDTGKVKFVLREYPLDQIAWAAAMVARCADESKFFPLIAVLLDKQETWARSQDPETELFNIVKQTGVTKEQFDACLKNQELAQNVMAVKERAATEFNVQSTPTLFVDGQMVTGDYSIEELAKLIDPKL